MAITLNPVSVGESSAFANTLGVTLTADALKGNPAEAAWLIVVTAALAHNSGGGGSLDVKPAITDAAPVGPPYWAANAKVGFEWGYHGANGPPFLSLNFATYLILNDLHVGDVVTIDNSANPIAVDWMQTRLHYCTGMNAAGPFGVSDPTHPNPPYSSGSLRPGGGATNGWDWGFGALYFSDLCWMFGAVDYTVGAAIPTKTFGDDSFASTFLVPEQFAMEALDAGPAADRHAFYAFNLFGSGAIQPMPHFCWLPSDSSHYEFLGFGQYFEGAGIPYPPNLGVVTLPYFIPVGNIPPPIG